MLNLWNWYAEVWQYMVKANSFTILITLNHMSHIKDKMKLALFYSLDLHKSVFFFQHGSDKYYYTQVCQWPYFYTLGLRSKYENKSADFWKRLPK